MDRVHDGLIRKEFTAPDSAKKVLICTSTGNLASKGCDYAKYEYFEDGTEPKKYCNNRTGPSGSSSGSGSSGKKPSNSGDDDSPNPTVKVPQDEDPDDDSDETTAPDEDGGDDINTQQPGTEKPAPTKKPSSGDNEPDVPQKPTAHPTDKPSDNDPIISLD